MSVQETENEAAKLYKAPRVALADIEAEITAVCYMTGEQFVSHARVVENKGKGNPHAADAAVMTICMVTMKNGFMVIGQATPASPENFDAAHGRKLAYERCIMQIWPLMGYMLKEQLHNTK